MSYERSLTFAAQVEIDRYVEQQAAKAAAQLDRQQTADELLAFLTDDTKLITPGFILRRHIQAQGGLASKEKCADLGQNGNVPWPDGVVYRTAAELSSISYRRHGLAISTAQWEKYLKDDMTQGLHRDMIFKLAIVTGMGRQAAMDLLLACGQAPYNMRCPLELICWFCQHIPGTYTWQGVQKLLDTYERFAAEGGGASPSQPPAEGTTQLLRWSVDKLLDTGDPAAETEQALMKLMAENCTELEGFSRTAQGNYLRLLAYLNTLYLLGQRANLHKLIGAMFEEQDWKFEDIHQSPGGERYVFRGGVEDEAAPREVNHLFDAALGEVALLCKRYYTRANAIQKGARDVDRRDVLLLGYFLITGYMGAEEDTRATLWNMTKQDNPVDRRMELLREDLDALRPEADMKEKQVLCCRVLNELLAEFGFRALYVPAAFDRFILLSLLTDRPAWTARYLLGEELED